MSVAVADAAIDLRPYQVEAVARIHETLGRVNSALLVMATGTGKTTVFAQVIEDRARLGRTLVIAHRGELLEQARRRIKDQTGLRCDVEKADQRANLSGFFPADVVVASVQSLMRERRRARFPRDSFATIIVDEAHHAPARSYRDIIDYFETAKTLGVTATPDRTDKTAMGLVFDDVAFVYDIRQAIDDGWLVPIRQRAVEVHGLDFSKIRDVAGELNEGQLEALLREEEHLHHIGQPTFELAGCRKTMVFCVTVAHAHDMARVLRGYGATAEALDGTAGEQERRAVLGRFARGETQFLCNCMLLTEGFDEPSVSCISVARPTKSRSLYCQMAGRGTRLAPGKSDLLLLDFRGNAGNHVLVAPQDILGGNYDPEVRERAEELANAGCPLHEALDRAAIEAAQAAEEKRRAQAALEKSRLQIESRKRVREVDPFGAIGLAGRAAPSGAPPTEAQIARLKRLKFPAEKHVWALDRKGASELIRALEKRREDGLCTWSQANLLGKYGFDQNVSFEVAKAQIDVIAQNGWRPPAAERMAAVAAQVAREPGVDG